MGDGRRLSSSLVLPHLPQEAILFPPTLLISVISSSKRAKTYSTLPGFERWLLPSGSSGLRLAGGKLNSAPLSRAGFFSVSLQEPQPFVQSVPLTMKPPTPLVAKKRMALSRLLGEN